MLRKFFILKIFALALILSANQSYSQVWEKIDGTKAYVNKIWFPNNNSQTIVVCSDEIPTDLNEHTPTFYPTTGSGYLISANSGESFTPKLEGLFVFDVVKSPANSNLWVAAIRQTSLGGIVLSSDGGENWDTENVKCSGTQQVWQIAPEKNSEQKFYMAAFNTSQGFSETNDKFETCTANTNFKISSRDLAISKANPSLMFIAGDKTGLGGVFRSYDNGKTWLKDSSGLEGLRIHCVLPAPANAAVVFCGADSLDANRESHGKGIFQSLDTGKTWELIGAAGESVFALTAHPSHPESFAAACGGSGVWVCGAIGKMWEQYNSGLPESASVRTVSIPDEEVTEEGFIVYAGTFGDGMYKSKRISTAVDADYTTSMKISGIYPQPSQGNFNVSYYLTDDTQVAFIIRNALGQEIFTKELGFVPSGNNTISISLSSSLQSGIYFLEVHAGNKASQSKILIAK